MGRTAVNVLGNTVAVKLVTHFGGQAACSRILTLTHVNWCKCRVLIHFKPAFTHQLKRCGKGRSQYGGAQCRLDQILGEILIERTPFERHADQPLQRFAKGRMRDRDHPPYAFGDWLAAQFGDTVFGRD